MIYFPRYLCTPEIFGCLTASGNIRWMPVVGKFLLVNNWMPKSLNRLKCIKGILMNKINYVITSLKVMKLSIFVLFFVASDINTIND